MESWLRKLTPGELMTCNVHKVNAFKMRYAITLNSKVELDESTLQLAFEALYRKVPSLRLCIRDKEGELWFHEMEKMKINFEKKSFDNYATDFEDIVCYHYDEPNGPLWCAYLYKSPAGAECSMPSVGKEFPLQYNLLIGFHHAITDGAASVRMCGVFIDILNHILEGKNIDVGEQIGLHSDDHKREELMEKFKKELETKPEWATPLDSFFSNYDIDLLTCNIFPAQAGLRPCTKTIEYIMNEKQTSNMIEKCSKEGVTVNSAFTVAVHFALYKIFNNNYPNTHSFPIPHMHVVNVRRYWNISEMYPLGAHVDVFFCKTNVDSSFVINNFWNCARSYHKDVKSQIDDFMPLRQMAYKIHKGTAETDEKLFTSPDNTEMVKTYFSTSNLGNLSSTFPGTGNVVQATHFNRGTQFRYLINMFYMHTFRGRFMSNLLYCEELLPEDGAQKINDLIFEVLLDAINAN